jgi:hypothetical protein
VREKYCWLVAGGWFVLREKYCWLVADKPNNMWMKGVSRELNIAGIGWQQGIHPILAGN